MQRMKSIHCVCFDQLTVKFLNEFRTGAQGMLTEPLNPIISFMIAPALVNNSNQFSYIHLSDIAPCQNRSAIGCFRAARLVSR